MVTADMRGLDTSGSTLAKIIREITGPDGEQHYGSVDGLKDAINAIKAGKNIWYVGATGPIDFDPYGDVATPFVMMKIKDMSMLVGYRLRRSLRLKLKFVQ